MRAGSETAVSAMSISSRMKDDTTRIRMLVAEGEHAHQDFKFAVSDIRKIAKSLSAFANGGGGRLLVGVKDNGKIAGVRSEEEMYMVEAAASVYCRPPLTLENRVCHAEGKDVLEVVVRESECKPVCALDEGGRPWAYIRIADENILASPVHLSLWKNRKKERSVMAYTEHERHLLNLLDKCGELTLNQCCRQGRGMTRKRICGLLADFIRFGLVEQIFRNHTFYYRLA